MPVVARSWEYIHDKPYRRGRRRDRSSSAPTEKLDPDILKEQIVEYKPFFSTDATKGKHFGWQAEEDWKGTHRGPGEDQLVPAGTKPSDYYTNKFVPSGM